MRNDWLQRISSGFKVLRDTVSGVDRERETQRLVRGVVALRQTDDQAVAIKPRANDRNCPCCGGSRCHAWRETDHSVGCGGHGEFDGCTRTDENGEIAPGCGGEPEPMPAGISFRRLMDNAIVRPGRHTVRYVAAHWVPWNWSPYPLALRARLWPQQWERRLGRPVYVGRFRRAAGVFP